jgi:NADH-quinone oxidoreductase subunit N
MMVLNNTGREDISAFRGLAWRGGAIPAAAMAVFLFSLAGIPPLAGFIGKFYLFAAVIEKQMWLLALVAGLNSVVALYYYARLIRTMYLDLPMDGDPVMSVDVHNSLLVGVLVLGTIVFGVYWTPVADLAQRSITFLGG